MIMVFNDDRCLHRSVCGPHGDSTNVHGFHDFRGSHGDSTNVHGSSNGRASSDRGSDQVQR